MLTYMQGKLGFLCCMLTIIVGIWSRFDVFVPTYLTICHLHTHIHIYTDIHMYLQGKLCCRLGRPSPYFTWPREAACDYALNGFVTCLGQLRSGKIWRPFRNKLSQPMPWILLQKFSVLPTYLQLKRRRCVQLSSSHICLVTRRHPACPSLSI